MRGRDLKLAVLGVACTAALGLGATFVWVGQGEDDRWDTCDNWAPVGIPPECYPSAVSDDAIIPYLSGGRTVDLIDIDRIDDFVIAGSVEFAQADPNDPNGVRLVANSLTIAGGESAETIVRITGAASIVVEAP
jgi:hypothetical protein